MGAIGSAAALAVTVALGCLTTSPTRSQALTSGPPAPPPSPQVVAAAHAYADTLIAASNTSDLFENVTTGDHAVVRHRLSGLECNFNGVGGELIRVFPSGAPRGDDVGCTSQWRGFTTSMDITRFANPMTTDQATAMYVASIKRVHPEAAPYTGKGVAIRLPNGQPLPCRTVKFLMTEGGQTVFSRLSVAAINGWVIEERVSGPLDNPTLGDMLGEAEMMMAIDSVGKKAG